MRGQDAAGDDALTVDEQALLDASAAAQPPPAEMPAGADAPQVDAGADPGADSAPEQPQVAQKMVPHEAMHQERRRAQEAEARLAAVERERADERKRYQTLEERTNLLLQQRFAQPEPAPVTKPAAPELPDINQDPVGNLKGDIGLLRNELAKRDQILAALAQAVSGQGRQSEAAQEANAIAARATALEREFAARTPDYQQAYEHLLNNRAEELRAAGWTDPAEIQSMLAREAHDLAARSIQRGVNPAETAYGLARVRGYRPAAADPAPQTDAAAAAQIATIAAGQQQARGINRVPGQVTPPTDAVALSNMSDEEFSAWASKATEKQRRQVGL